MRWGTTRSRGLSSGSTAPRLRRAALLRLLAVVGILGAGRGRLPTAAAGEPGATPFVQVRIDQVTPQVATTTSEPVVTVTGTVTNIGDRPVRDVMVRLEHAAAVSTSAGLRTNLDGGTDQYQAAEDFVTVAPELRRGQKTQFTLSAPMRSATKHFAGYQRARRLPAAGQRQRHTRLRRAGPAGQRPIPAAGGGRAGRSTGHFRRRDERHGRCVAPDTSKPVPVTMLWPLADRPRLAPGVPGGTIPVRLMDDELATSLATGGRLDVLLAAAEFATSRDVDPDGAVSRSVCLAVDPDLLVTVNAMTAGYVVSNSPDGPAQQPGTPTHPGTGQAAAATWLNRLRALAHRMCVAPLPYAQADLDAVQRVGDPGLSATATSGAGDIVDQILGVAAVRGATLIPDGSLTRRSVDLLSANGNTVVIAAADFAAGDSSAPAPPTADTAPRRLSPQVVTAPFDPAVGAAFGGDRHRSGRAHLPGLRAGGPACSTTPTPPAVRTRWARCCGVPCSRGVTPRAQILMPPTNWKLRSDDAGAILTTLATAIRSGLAVPRPLPALIADACQPPGRSPERRNRPTSTPPSAAGSTTPSSARSPARWAGCRG